MISETIMKNYDRAAEMVAIEKATGQTDIGREFYAEFSMCVATVKASVDNARAGNEEIMFVRARIIDGIEAIERDAHGLGGVATVRTSTPPESLQQPGRPPSATAERAAR